jgi:hypothetical protein
MKSFKYLAASTLALLLACTSAAAQQVYRCGSSYSQTPCSGATAVPTDDARTEAQRAAAAQALRQDKLLAKEMEASRHKDEAMAVARAKAEQSAQAHNVAAHKKMDETKARETKPRKKPASMRTVKVQEPGIFTATVGNDKPKKKKTARKATP